MHYRATAVRVAQQMGGAVCVLCVCCVCGVSACTGVAHQVFEGFNEVQASVEGMLDGLLPWGDAGATGATSDPSSNGGAKI